MDYFIYSGGEVHLTGKARHQITITDYTMNGFMALCQQGEIMRRHGVSLSVIYPYLPYARQDRIMGEYDPFSLQTFCDLLNSQKFASVTIFDPHSDVASALINNCKTVPQWHIAQQAIPDSYFNDENAIFVSPDAGAYKKLSKLIADDERIAVGMKRRAADGSIANVDIFTRAPLSGKTCIIVDDICDGGRTFITLSRKLKEQGAAKVLLYVTHGIFSQGVDVLKGYIDQIFTTNSFPNVTSDFMRVIDIV